MATADVEEMSESLLATEESEANETQADPQDPIDASEELIADADIPDQGSLDTDPTTASTKMDKLTQFPMARVRNIMKLDPDVTVASQDAVFMVSKALELFIESLAVESFGYTAHSKKKTVSKEDVSRAIGAVDALAFLDGALD